mgnify:CR=1 FL=1|tara:strand:+ start:5487 stop:6308 length:822 start_codon:yes stop_codon:yes gene_type:complete
MNNLNNNLENFEDDLYNLEGNTISNDLNEKINHANYSENFETLLDGNQYVDGFENLEDNFENDEEIEVLNKDLSESVNFKDTNNITNFITPQQSFDKYNVIPNSGLKSQLINRPYNVVLYKDITGTHTFTLNETIKNVVSVKLLSAYGSSQKSTAWGGKFFAILHINELIKNVSAYDASDPVDNNNALNKLDNSFAVLENYDNYQTSSGTGRNWYRNEFIHNHDIMYFDPPKPQLKNLTMTIYDTPFTNTASTAALQLRMNLLIETTEKLRVY